MYEDGRRGVADDPAAPAAGEGWQRRWVADLEALLESEPGAVLAAAVEDASDRDLGRTADLSDDGLILLAPALSGCSAGR